MGVIGKVQATHESIQNGKTNGTDSNPTNQTHHVHVCPHKTGTGALNDRNSTFPMIDVKEALKLIFDKLTTCQTFDAVVSSVNLPPFRASIKDGYALRSTAGIGVKKVVGYVSAGDPVINSIVNQFYQKCRTIFFLNELRYWICLWVMTNALKLIPEHRYQQMLMQLYKLKIQNCAVQKVMLRKRLKFL